MRFDILNRKPSLWNIVITTGITAVVILIIALVAKTSVFGIIMLVLDAYLVIVIWMLLGAWVRQIWYNPYSYNTVYYMGFVFFLLFIFALMVTMTVAVFLYPEAYTFAYCLDMIMHSARNFMLITSPFILTYSVALVISNISLVRHEGYSVVNSLGIVLAVALVAGEVFLYFFDHTAIYFVADLFAAIYLYFECMLIGTIISNILVVTHKPDPDKDFIIILGCAIRKDGTPRPLLQGRIDRAIEFASDQESKTGKKAVFVCSGGQGPNETIPESRSMRNYLVEHGISEDRIIEEDKSTNTLENMRFSKEKIYAVDPKARVIFCTTNYHVFRSGTYARKVKMRAVGIAAKTKWYFWPNASVREFVSLLTEHRGKQVMVLSGIMLIFVALLIATVFAG